MRQKQGKSATFNSLGAVRASNAALHFPSMGGADAHWRSVMFEFVFMGIVVGALAVGLVTRVALRQSYLPDPHQLGLGA
jgi:hypothetical protein